MASPGNNGSERPPRAGYLAAIIVSALSHAALVVLIFFVAPRFLHSDDQPPPAYTAKIVDSVPAGDLGTHLPRLVPRKEEQAKPEERQKAEEQKPPEVKPPDDDKNAIALNTNVLETPTPTPTPEPTPEPTEAPPSPTPTPTEAAKKHPSPAPTPKPAAKAKPKAKATPVMLAKVEPTPDMRTKMDKLRAQLLAEELKRQEEARAKDEDSSEDDHDTKKPPDTTGPKGKGPVVGLIPREGKGSGTGSGEGSEGMLQDPEFVEYYQAVQDKIKKAWSFVGGASDLNATVDFSIGSDGTLNSVKIAKSSNDLSFDDSVIRAIRGAAPFPAPPDKYRSEFMDGIEAQFALAELNKK
ncbi:MAG: energy transducer TonB [Candidatus Binataceae bacterium]